MNKAMSIPAHQNNDYFSGFSLATVDTNLRRILRFSKIFENTTVDLRVICLELLLKLDLGGFVSMGMI